MLSFLLALQELESFSCCNLSFGKQKPSRIGKWKWRTFLLQNYRQTSSSSKKVDSLIVLLPKSNRSLVSFKGRFIWKISKRNATKNTVTLIVYSLLAFLYYYSPSHSDLVGDDSGNCSCNLKIWKDTSKNPARQKPAWEDNDQITLAFIQCFAWREIYFIKLKS